MTALIDTHCHLTDPKLFDRLGAVVADAAEVGVTEMITVACSGAGEYHRGLEITRQYPAVKLAAGIHPHEAARATDEDWQTLTAVWTAPATVAAGEMGLDFHYDFSPRPVQKEVFARQLERAAETNLPVVVHCRQAFDEVVTILEKQGYANRPVIFHCFSETVSSLEVVRSHGWRVSLTGVVTFKKAVDTQAVCRALTDDELIFETDAPYLSPEPMRKIRPNEPKLLPHILQFVAELRGQPFETVAALSSENGRRFYGMGLSASR